MATHEVTAARPAGSLLDSWLFVRLVLLGLAVMATLIRFWAPLTLVWWLLAAAGVVSVLLRHPGRDAVDWVARGVGAVVAAVIILGIAMNAISIRLESATWALVLGVIGAVIVIGSHLLEQRRRLAWAQSQPAGHVGRLDLGQRSVAEDLASGWRAFVRRPGQAVWLLVAAALVTTAVTIGARTEPTDRPELEFSLSDPAAASTTATAVKVRITARERIDNLLLRVQLPNGTTGTPQRFAVPAGESVERTVTLPATGDSQILLTSPGKPTLGRTLTINR